MAVLKQPGRIVPPIDRTREPGFIPQDSDPLVSAIMVEMASVHGYLPSHYRPHAEKVAKMLRDKGLLLPAPHM